MQSTFAEDLSNILDKLVNESNYNERLLQDISRDTDIKIKKLEVVGLRYYRIEEFNTITLILYHNIFFLSGNRREDSFVQYNVSD
jgi:hypothetical protein